MPFNSSFYKAIKYSLHRLGQETVCFDYRKGDLLIRVLRFVPIVGRDLATQLVSKKIISISDKYDPDIVIAIKGELLDKKLLSAISKKNNMVVNWFPDPMNLWKLMLKISPPYDIFLHFDPFIVEKLKKAGRKNVVYFPFAADIQTSKNIPKVYDVTFIGTYSKDREKVLSNLTKFDLNVWGDPKWQKSQLSSFVRGGRISQDEMKSIIKKSKININIHHASPGNGANLRTFEVTGCGGFLLSDNRKDLKNLFSIGEDIEIYKTVIELKSKVRLYLNDNKARNTIAKNGYKKAASLHRYERRIDQMLNLINEFS